MDSDTQKSWLAILALGCSLLLGGAAATVRADDVAQGREIYLQDCASCHGLEGEGDGPTSPALRKKPADLTSLAKNNGGVFPAEEVHDFIYGTRTVAAHGTREMPVWGYAFMFRQGGLAGPFVPERTPQEAEDKIAKLVDYVKSIQRK